MIALFSSERSRVLALLGALGALALGLDAWQTAVQRSGGQTWLENAVCAAAAPAQEALLDATRRVEGAWKAVVGARRLARENARLSGEVADLRAELNRVRESYRAAQREGALRASYAGAQGPQRVARVIGVGAGGWLSWFVVDRGAADGVRVRDVAVTREGVVGQVYAVAAHTARVLPITDQASGVSVRAQRTRETGVVKGMGGWRCELRYLGPLAQVRAGDELLTAGLGGVFPKGLRVGRVSAVVPDASTSGKMAEVEPAAKMENVEEVLLLRLPLGAE